MKRVVSLSAILLAFAHPGLTQRALQNNSPTSASTATSAGVKPSMGASLFYSLMVVGTNSDTPEYWASALQDASITTEELENLRKFAKYARATNMEFQIREMEKLCAGKSSLTTLDTVAGALTKFSASNTANIEQLGNEAPKALGERLGGLLLAANKNLPFKVVETNHKELMTTMNLEPVAHIEKVCANRPKNPL